MPSRRVRQKPAAKRPRTLVERRIGIETLRADLYRAQGVARPHGTGHLAELVSDHGAAGRKLLASVIDSLELRVSGSDEDELLAALRLIRQLFDDKRRWLPGFSPSAFIDAQWRAQVVDTARGRLDRHAYELCAAYELRSALRAGRVWVPGSRRHADPPSLLLPAERWEQTRSEFASAVELPISGPERLDSLAQEQSELLQRLAREHRPGPRRRRGDRRRRGRAGGGAARALIEPMLPELDLPDLLIEVDGWTGFSEHLVPLSSNRRRSNDMPALLYAVILAQATNLGLTGMARASEFSYQQLEWAWNSSAAKTP